MSQIRIDIAGRKAFIETAADLMRRKIISSIAAHGSCTIGLSGGSTPVPVYQRLAKLPDIDWKNVFVFLTDERHIDSNHPDSNQRLVRQTLAMSVPIPEDHLIFPDTSLPHEECATGYGARLGAHLASHAPDMVVLGMGLDGHITSLFPPVPAEAWGPYAAIATHTPLDAAGAPLFAVHRRISTTFPVLKRSASCLLLLGKEKLPLWEAMEKGAEDATRWPIKELLSDECVVLMQLSEESR
jgi:6-phosphogluconolactonase